MPYLINNLYISICINIIIITIYIVYIVYI